VAAVTRRRRSHYTGHENDEGGALFQWLLEQIGCSAEAAERTQHAWAESTFRKYRRTLTHLSDFLKRAGKPKELLMDTRQAVGTMMSFLIEAEKQGESGASLKAMAGHTIRIVQMIHPLGETSALHLLGKAIRRKYPVANRVRDTIWDLDVLLDHLRTAYPNNEALTPKVLMNKTMILIMVFAASRPAELARMEMPAAGDVGETEARLRATPKQRGSERTSVIVHKVSLTSLCPLAALKAWLRKQRDVSPWLFTCELGGQAAADPSEAGCRAPGDAVPVGSRGAPRGLSGSTSLPAARPPDIACPPRGFRDLTTRDVSTAFKAIMAAAGIPPRYPAYSIRHATVTALFTRGASDEEVAAFGRWAPGSRVPRLFYFIRATDGTWIGKKLLEEQPALKVEFLLLSGQEQSGAEAEDEPRETDSSPASEAK
jgi:hypothetical protein